MQQLVIIAIMCFAASRSLKSSTKRLRNRSIVRPRKQGSFVSNIIDTSEVKH